MDNLVLSLEQVKQLNAFVDDIPTRYGMPIKNFLAQIANAQVAAEKTAKSDKKGTDKADVEAPAPTPASKKRKVVASPSNE